jgi:hypothetical protein
MKADPRSRYLVGVTSRQFVPPHLRQGGNSCPCGIVMRSPQFVQA